VDHLSFSFGTVGKSIAIRKDIQDATMELETAVPVGFIVTELVSNCLKHAFPDRTQGEIRIALHRCNDDQFELTVSDNGVGIPQRVDFANPRSMGLDLVSVFARQLEGEIQVNRESGTEIQVKFRNIGGRQCNFSKSPG